MKYFFPIATALALVAALWLLPVRAADVVFLTGKTLECCTLSKDGAAMTVEASQRGKPAIEERSAFGAHSPRPPADISHTPELGRSPALQPIPARVIAKQSVPHVDATSSATITEVWTGPASRFARRRTGVSGR